MKIDKEVIKKITIGAGKIFAYGSLILLSTRLRKEVRNIYYDDIIDFEDYDKRIDCEDYNDAIECIINSDMSSYYKNVALKMVKKDMDKKYYKAVSAIVSGDDTDYYKVTMINGLYNDKDQA